MANDFTKRISKTRRKSLIKYGMILLNRTPYCASKVLYQVLLIERKELEWVTTMNDLKGNHYNIHVHSKLVNL